MLSSGRVLAVVALAGLLAACGSGSQAPSAEGQAAAEGAAAAGAATAAGGYDIEALVANADVKRGQVLFLQCRACHSLGEGEPHKVGPNLYGFYGRKAGQAPGFAYSDAIANADVTWSAETLDQWLSRPSEFLPGNRMVFIGVTNPQDRANVIAYLKQETGAM